MVVGEEGGEEEKEEAKETGEAADAQGNNEEEKRSSADEPTAALEGFAALALAGGDAAAKEAALLAITEGEKKQPFVPPTKPRRYRVGLRLNNKAAEVAENEIPPGSAPRFAPPVSMKYLDERVLVNVNFDKSTKVARVETLQPSSDARTVFIYNCSDLLSLLDDDEDSDIDRADNNDPVGLRDVPPPWTAEFWVQPSLAGAGGGCLASSVSTIRSNGGTNLSKRYSKLQTADAVVGPASGRHLVILRASPAIARSRSGHGRARMSSVQSKSMRTRPEHHLHGTD